MSIKSTALKGVDPQVIKRAERAQKWMGTARGKEAVRSIVKRAKVEEDRMREAQRIGAEPLNKVTL